MWRACRQSGLANLLSTNEPARLTGLDADVV